jgi:hypothetical protein
VPDQVQAVVVLALAQRESVLGLAQPLGLPLAQAQVPVASLAPERPQL